VPDIDAAAAPCNGEDMFCLVVALPSPGCPGAPRGQFYPNNEFGRACAEKFAQENRRPGFGVFESGYTFADADVNMSTFNAVIREMGWQDE
jgi:hypothetical protein